MNLFHTMKIIWIAIFLFPVIIRKLNGSVYRKDIYHETLLQRFKNILMLINKMAYYTLHALHKHVT